MRPRPVVLLTLAAALLITTTAAAITGHARIGSCPEGGWECALTFEGSAGNDLIWAQWDFNGTGAWWNAGGPIICPDHVEDLQSWYEGFPHVSDSQQWTLSQIVGFEGGDSVRFGAPLYAADGMLDHDDLAGGTLQVQFQDGTLLAADFDTPTEWPYGAIAYFQDANLPNLVPAGPPGWAFPAVPRPTDDATFESVPSPTTLVGDAEATWLNGELRNVGTANASSSRIQLRLDGQVHVQSTILVFPTGAYNGRRNAGPYTVTGGRHTLTAVADASSQIFEASETDNRWARQWVWEPASLVAGETATRAAPPAQFGGTEDLPQYAYNCDGVRMHTDADRWHVAWLATENVAVTYPLVLYEASSGPDHGFDGDSYLAAAGPGFYELRFLALDTRSMAAGPYDLGVVNPDGSTGAYQVTHVVQEPTTLGMGDDLALAVHRLAICDVFLGADDLGDVVFTLDIGQTEGRVQLGYLTPDDDLTASDAWPHDTFNTADLGRCYQRFTAEQVGHYALVVWSDLDDGVEYFSATVGVRPRLPDMRPYVPNGYAEPVVPRSEQGSGWYDCPAPDTLHGFSEATWWNGAGMNSGNADADTFRIGLSLDGRLFAEESTEEPVLQGSGVRILDLGDAYGQPLAVPGGRHTATIRMDTRETLDELWEANNAWSVQYCWSPLAIPPNACTTRGYPPPRQGGWDHAPPGAAFHDNCDGFRLDHPDPVDDNWWSAMAVMPNSYGTNLDCRLYEPLVGTTDGFAGTPLVESAWDGNAVDFVLVNYRDAPPSDHDLAVVLIESTLPSLYTVNHAGSIWQGENPHGGIGPYRMWDVPLIHLHEVRLDPGPVLISLNNLSGDVDWGLSIYRADQPYLAKSDCLDGGMAWQAGPGEPETILVDIPARDDYCVAVWRVGQGTAHTWGDYRLWFTPEATAVPETGPDIPTATGLVAISPNPFNPQTVIAFDLAETSRITLTVHDVRGRQLRRLVAGELPAGHHGATWDGLDDVGHQIASGVYFARLAVEGGQQDLRKLTLVR